MVWMSVNLILHSLCHLHHFKVSWDLIRRFLGLYLQIIKSTIQTSKKHLCHANSVVDPRERPGGSSLPHLFLDQTEAQRAKKYFFEDHPPPPPPQLISRSGSSTRSTPVSLGIMLFFIFRIKSFNAFCIFLRLGNSAWDFWAVSFGPGIVLGFVGSPKNFLGFWVLSLFDHPCHLKSRVPPWD